MLPPPPLFSRSCFLIRNWRRARPHQPPNPILVTLEPQKNQKKVPRSASKPREPTTIFVPTPATPLHLIFTVHAHPPTNVQDSKYSPISVLMEKKRPASGLSPSVIEVDVVPILHRSVYPYVSWPSAMYNAKDGIRSTHVPYYYVRTEYESAYIASDRQPTREGKKERRTN